MLVIALNMLGCTTEPRKVPPAAYQASKAGCVAFYPIGDQLAIVTAFRTSRSQLTLYSPANGLFVSTPLFGLSKCDDVNVRSILEKWTTGRLPLYAITNNEAKSIIDNATIDPAAAVSFIQLGPPYFREDNMWKERLFVLALDEQVEITVKDLPVDLALKSITKEQSARIIAAQNARSVERTRVALERQRELNRQLDLGKQVWERRLLATYTLGDQVCTMKGNFYGNVEAVSGERLKVHVIGQARMSSDGFFFYTYQPTSFDGIRIEAPRWFERNEIAHCVFTTTR